MKIYLIKSVVEVQGTKAYEAGTFLEVTRDWGKQLISERKAIEFGDGLVFIDGRRNERLIKQNEAIQLRNRNGVFWHEKLKDHGYKFLRIQRIKETNTPTPNNQSGLDIEPSPKKRNRKPKMRIQQIIIICIPMIVAILIIATLSFPKVTSSINITSNQRNIIMIILGFSSSVVSYIIAYNNSKWSKQ